MESPEGSSSQPAQKEEQGKAMKALSPKDSAAINDLLRQAMIAILLEAQEKECELPFIIDITDGDGKTVSYTLSKGLEIGSHEDSHKLLVYPFNVVLTDRAGKTLRSEIKQPERTQ